MTIDRPVLDTGEMSAVCVGPSDTGALGIRRSSAARSGSAHGAQSPAAFRGKETAARILIAAGPYRISGECGAAGLSIVSTGTSTLPTAPCIACTRMARNGFWMATMTDPPYVELRCRRPSAFSTGLLCRRIWPRRLPAWDTRR